MENDNMIENSIVSVDNKIEHKRRTLISDQDFINAHTQAENLEDIINFFPHFQAMDKTKAKLYISVKASILRKSHPEMKVFKKGRKNTKKTIFEE